MWRLRVKELGQLIDGFLERFAGAEYADLVGHDLLHARAQRRGILFAVLARSERREVLLLAPQSVAHQCSGQRDFVLRRVAVVGDVLTDDHAGHDGLGDGIAAQPIEPVHVPAGRLAGGKQSLERRTLAGVIGAHAAHGVVLRGPHRDHLVDRIDAEEVFADLLDLAQIGFDVLGA